MSIVFFKVKIRIASVFTHSMMTIYLSLSVQVAKSNFFMKSPASVPERKKGTKLYLIIKNNFNVPRLAGGLHMVSNSHIFRPNVILPFPTQKH